MSAKIKFLIALASAIKNGAVRTIQQAMAFAKREFGEIDKSFVDDIVNVFKKEGKTKKGDVVPIKKKIDLSKYDDDALNALAVEGNRIKTKLDELGKSGTNYEEFKKLSARKKEIDDILSAAQDIPASGIGSFKADMELAKIGEKAKVKTTKVSDDVMEKAYDEVSHQLNRGDIKYEADVLAESIAEQQGKVYDDLADAERTELYSQAYQRVAKDLKMRMDIKKGVADVMKDTSEAGLARSIEVDNLKLEFPGISDKMIENILTDMNPQRIAEVKATMKEALKMQEKMSPDEIIDVFKRTPRTKQASGGRVSMVKGGLAGVLGV